MRNILFLFIFCLISKGFSQELNCNLVVNAQQTGNENFPIFKTLEKQLTEFINNTKWTNKTLKFQERIDCSMVINVTSYSGENFQASRNLNEIDESIPTKLVVNAVLSTDRSGLILSSILDGSKAKRPITIPTNVPSIPNDVISDGA